MKNMMSLVVVSLLVAACGRSPIQPSPLQNLQPSLLENGAPTIPAAVAQPVRAKQAIPLRGTLEAVEVHTGVPPSLHSVLTGTGHATQLGRFTATFDFQIDLTTLTSVGSFILTAANGDNISGTFTGQGTPLEGALSVVETATITAGTGRFADATGSFTIERVLLADSVTHSSSGSFDGTIDLNH
jgi:hypothetical protein